MPQVSIAALAVAAQAGELIAFPTDTVPALACQPAAAAKIYEAKQRSSEKPLILMAATPEALWPYVSGDAEAQAAWAAVAAQYWPGALTLVLPKSGLVPSCMNPETPETIGVRVPNWPLAQQILSQTGPLATTSLNRSGNPPLEDLDAIAAEFPTLLTSNIWELPPQGDRIPSTVVRWRDQGWQILRQGAIQLALASES